MTLVHMALIAQVPNLDVSNSGYSENGNATIGIICLMVSAQLLLLQFEDFLYQKIYRQRVRVHQDVAIIG